MISPDPYTVQHGGFVPEPASAWPGLLVTTCVLSEKWWFAWARSSDMLDIAEFSHCHVCPSAEHCPHALG